MDYYQQVIVNLSVMMAIIIGFIGMIFGVTAAVKRKSKRSGLLVFMWSLFVGLLGSIAGFYAGESWVNWTLDNNPKLTNPHLNGLSMASIAFSLFYRHFIYWVFGSILGALLGGFCGLMLYKSHRS